MTPGSNDNAKCPVCRGKSGNEANAAIGMVLSAAKAKATSDLLTMKDCTELSSQFDFHVAVTLYVDAIEVLAPIFGTDVETYFNTAIEQLHEQIKEDNRSVPGDPDSACDEGDGV